MSFYIPCHHKWLGRKEKNVIKIRVFKAENNKHKTYYAVIGASSIGEAVIEVIKFKKKSLGDFLDYRYIDGYIAPYKEGLDGLWFGKPKPFSIVSERCHIVWKE